MHTAFARLHRSHPTTRYCRHLSSAHLPLPPLPPPLPPRDSTRQHGALHGVRVLDLTRILGGPFATQQLADHGATVLKIERPFTGDDTRTWQPPSLPQSALSAYFVACNRGKLSVCLDLKKKKAQELLLELAKNCHVMVDNFLPGDLDKLNLSYERIRAACPQLHVATLTSYGSKGPQAKQPSYDVILCAEGGLMSITGTEEHAVKPGVAITDLLSGLFLSNAIMAALVEDASMRERGLPCVGQRIETSLFASQIAMLTSIGQAALVDPSYVAKRFGTSHPSIVPYQAFPCANQTQIVAGALNDAQFQSLCVHALQRHDLARDARFQTNALRVQHRVILLAELTASFSNKTADAWIPILKQAHIPCSIVNSVRTALQHPQIEALGLIQPVPQSGESHAVPMLAPPVTMSCTPPSIARGAPLLGEHTREVLRDWLRLPEEEIDRLHRDGVVQCH